MYIDTKLVYKHRVYCTVGKFENNEFCCFMLNTINHLLHTYIRYSRKFSRLALNDRFHELFQGSTGLPWHAWLYTVRFPGINFGTNMHSGMQLHYNNDSISL